MRIIGRFALLILLVIFFELNFAITIPLNAESDALNFPSSEGTFHNAALHPGADPYAFYDEPSGLYYAYSTNGQEPGWLFAIYSSPDLSTWKRESGGAMQACINNGTSFQVGQMCWARDWHWAPEVYHNAKTGWYFLFFGGRLRPDLRKYYFQYSEYAEATKIGVAVSRSPRGPFEEIEPYPIDYYPYDPYYHDINLIMDQAQRQPPQHRNTSLQAPKGTFIASIDPNLYISKGAKEIYLYFSRLSYRHWVWDKTYEKFIEEGAIVAVQLTTDWWNDPSAKTMPSIVERERNRFASEAPSLPYNITSYNGTGEIGYPPRKDGWTAVITYQADLQAWENDSIEDYYKSNGILKDRRFTEGSTCISRKRTNGSLIYLLTYSANFFASENCELLDVPDTSTALAYSESLDGMGFATATHPLGPFSKSSSNPILFETFELGIPIVSTGHGSIVASRPAEDTRALNFQQVANYDMTAKEEADIKVDPQQVMYETPIGSELFYVHHARNSTEAERALYTTRLTLNTTGRISKKTKDAEMVMHLTAQDQPLPRGTAPISLKINESPGRFCSGRNIVVELSVQAASGTAFEPAEASNRVVLREKEEGEDKEDLAPLYSTLLEDKVTSLMLFRRDHTDSIAEATVWYQRRSYLGTWVDVVGAKMQCS